MYKYKRVAENMGKRSGTMDHVAILNLVWKGVRVRGPPAQSDKISSAGLGLTKQVMPGDERGVLKRVGGQEKETEFTTTGDFM
jgi:hypothetical protein